MPLPAGVGGTKRVLAAIPFMPVVSHRPVTHVESPYGDSMVKIAPIAGLGNYLLMFGRRALCPQTSLSIAGFPGIPELRVVEVQRHKRFLRREEMPR